MFEITNSETTCVILQTMVWEAEGRLSSSSTPASHCCLCFFILVNRMPRVNFTKFGL